jgi:hypothetical protein
MNTSVNAKPPKPKFRLVGCVRNEVFSGWKMAPYYIFESETYGLVHITAEDFWEIPRKIAFPAH